MILLLNLSVYKWFPNFKHCNSFILEVLSVQEHSLDSGIVKFIGGVQQLKFIQIERKSSGN